MKYVTGRHAMNLPCSLGTWGDYRTSAVNWDKLTILDSEDSVFGDYGIETGRTISFLADNKEYNIANHIRAFLDLLTIGDYASAEGMKEEYIRDDSFAEEIFAKVSMLRSRPNWQIIDLFMEHEYLNQWELYKKGILNDYTQNTKPILEIQAAIIPILQAYQIKSAYLFGSYARGEATWKSDIDLRLDTKGSQVKSLIDESGLFIKLKTALHCGIDMVACSLDEIVDDDFRKTLEREEIKIYDSNLRYTISKKDKPVYYDTFYESLKAHGLLEQYKRKPYWIKKHSKKRFSAVEDKIKKTISSAETGLNTDIVNYFMQWLTSDRGGIIPEIYDKNNPTNICKNNDLKK